MTLAHTTYRAARAAALSLAIGMAASGSTVAAPTDADKPPGVGRCAPIDLALVASNQSASAAAVLDAIVESRLRACERLADDYESAAPARAVAKNAYGTAFSQPQNVAKPAECDARSSSATTRLAALEACSTWVARYVTASATSAPPAPLGYHTPGPDATPDASQAPVLPAPATPPSHASASSTAEPPQWRKVVYVLVPGADAPTASQVALQLAERLANRARRHARDPFDARNLDVGYDVVAQPGWSVERYQQQCANDASTAGAVVVLPPSAKSSSFNFFYSESTTTIGMQAIVADCEPVDATYTNNLAYITYVTDVVTNSNHRASFSLSTILGALSGYLALHPAKSETFAVVPPKTLPGAGGSYQTGYSVNDNQQIALGAAAGAAALTPLSGTNLGYGNNPDAQASAAIAKDLAALVPRLLAACARRGVGPWAMQCEWLEP